MAIGTTIPMSVSTVGSTVHTVTRVIPGQYSLSLTPVAGQPTVPLIVSVFPAQLGARNRTFRINLKYDVSQIEAAGSATLAFLGKFSASLTVSFRVGTVITDALVLQLVQELGSICAQSAVINALRDGSVD